MSSQEFEESDSELEYDLDTTAEALCKLSKEEIIESSDSEEDYRERFKKAFFKGYNDASQEDNERKKEIYKKEMSDIPVPMTPKICRYSFNKGYNTRKREQEIEEEEREERKRERLTARVDPTVNDNQPLIDACEGGHFGIVEKLLACEEVDPSAQQSKALTEAIRHDRFLIRDLLLEDGRVDPSANNNLAIRLAVLKGQEITVSKLLEYRKENKKEDKKVADLVNHTHLD